MKIIRLLLISILFFSCKEKKETTQLPKQNDQDFFKSVLALDTISREFRLKSIDVLLTKQTDTATNTYKFLKAKQSDLNDKTDSVAFFVAKIKLNKNEPEWQVLKQYLQSDLNVLNSHTIEHDKVAVVLEQINFAEKNHSQFTYLLYDLLAKTCYLNGNDAKAKEYSLKFFENHPFKEFKIVKNKFYKNLFNLAVHSEDIEAMKDALGKFKQINSKSQDSIDYYEIVNYEAQYLCYTGKTQGAVELNKKHFDYKERNNKLLVTDFNNMATTHLKNNNYDAAITYYEKGIAWATKNDPDANLQNVYSGLTEVNREKNDYKQAYHWLDEAVKHYINNQEKIQSLKIEELNKKFETEKKDLEIKDLEEKNALNKTKIAQQSVLFIGLLVLVLLSILIIYILQKRKAIIEKNEHLSLENQRLTLEQKVRQNQLNPHFIYNAIANLQGLISNSNQKELANQYLVSFSKLMRDFLELNRHDFISLSEEIGALENYLHLQQMRYQDKFEYSIAITDFEPSEVHIPPMLLQPFIENAIEHGFNNIAYKGQISLKFNIENEKLHIIIEDNGKGKLAKPTNLKKQSLSKIITQERLALVFKKEAWFTSNFKENNSGFIVEIHLPLITN